jgi:cathepsin L
MIAISVVGYGLSGGAVSSAQDEKGTAPAKGQAAPEKVQSVTVPQIQSLRQTINGITPVGVSETIAEINRSRRHRASYTGFAKDAVHRALLARDRIPELSNLPPITADPNVFGKALANLTKEQFAAITAFTIKSLTGTTPPKDLRDRIRKQNTHADAVLKSALPSLKAALALGRPVSVNDDTFDWRSRGLIVQNTGIVTASKLQGSCGCCWAFATIGVVEAAYARSDLRLIAASEQYLLNESRKYLADAEVPYTCEGGWWAFDMLVPNKLPGLASAGVPTAADLIYTGDDPSSTPPGLSFPYQLVTWKYVSSASDPAEIPSDRELKQALIDHGPLAVAVWVDKHGDQIWMTQDGTSVIQEFANDPQNNVTHAIMIVGWNNSKNAWIIKNSWGDAWGTHGFGYVGYGQNNIGWGAAYVVAAP